MQVEKNDHGSVLVFVTLMIVLLLVMVGLGLDTGQLTYVRNQGQAAVDAAALAAVSALPSGSPAQVAGRAAGFNSTNNYVESGTNAISSASNSVNVSYVQYDFTSNTITNYSATIGTANGVRVALEQSSGGTGITTPVFLTPLMRLFGVNATTASGTKDVNVSAVAAITATPSIPIAIWDSLCSGSTKVKDVELKMQKPGSENACWTTYLDKSSGAPDIKALFAVSETCSGRPIGMIDIGTPIYQNKGSVNTVYDVAKQFFFTDHKTTPCWIVPVIQGSGNCAAKDPTPITDWASICPSEISGNGANTVIKADVTCNQNIHQASGSLCFSQRLVREHKIKM